MSQTPNMAQSATPDGDRLLALYQRHAASHGHTVLDAAAAADAFLAGPGDRVLLLADDPRLVPESWDVAVILPDAVKPVAVRLTVGLALPAVARPIAARYGVSLWPALLFVRDGQYVGLLEGMRDWAVYAKEIPAVLNQPVSRAPGIGIPVTRAASGTSCT